VQSCASIELLCMICYLMYEYHHFIIYLNTILLTNVLLQVISIDCTPHNVQQLLCSDGVGYGDATIAAAIPPTTTHRRRLESAELLLTLHVAQTLWGHLGAELGDQVLASPEKSCRDTVADLAVDDLGVSVQLRVFVDLGDRCLALLHDTCSKYHHHS